MLSDDGVIIFDGHTRLSIMPAGEPALGYPCRVQVVSGLVSASFEAEAKIDPVFRQALAQLQSSMKGEATIEFWSEAHSIAIQGDGTGRVSVIANICEEDRARLTAQLLLDQSYLPAIIQDINRHFRKKKRRPKAALSSSANSFVSP